LPTPSREMILGSIDPAARPSCIYVSISTMDVRFDALPGLANDLTNGRKIGYRYSRTYARFPVKTRNRWRFLGDDEQTSPGACAEQSRANRSSKR